MAALTLGIGAAVSLVTASTYATRYAAVIYPLVALLIAAGLACFDDPAGADRGAAAFLALCLLGAYWNVTYPAHPGAGARPRPSTRSAKPGDVVAFCPDQLGPAFSRSLIRTSASTRWCTRPSARPLRVDWVDYAERNAAADPQSYAAELLARAGSPPDLPGLAGRLPHPGRAVRGAAQRLGPGPSRGATTIVVGGGDKYFEPGSVTMFPPPAHSGPRLSQDA